VPLLILHLREDREGAHKLSQRLKERGLEAWSLYQILPGDSEVREVDVRIARGDILFVYGSLRAAGATFIRRICDATRKWSADQGTKQLIVGRMEPGADVELLHPGSEIAEFAQNYAAALDGLCAAIGPSSCAVSYDTLLQLLREGNRIRIDAYVGDKYRPNLYVARELERQIRASVSDPKFLLKSCKEVLDLVLRPWPNVSGKQEALWNKAARRPSDTELRAIKRAHQACTNESVLKDPAPLLDVASALLPPAYHDVTAELAQYQDYVLADPSHLSINKLQALHLSLEEQLRGATVTPECMSTLQACWLALTETWQNNDHREALGKPHADERLHQWVDAGNGELRVVTRKLSASNSSTSESEAFATARHRLDLLRRAIESWARSGAIGIRAVRRGEGNSDDQIEFVGLSEVLDRCEALAEAVSRRCLVVVDVAGSGKTNMLSAVSQNESLKFPTIVLFAKGFRETSNLIEEQLNEVSRGTDATGSNLQFIQLLEAWHKELEKRETYWLVMIDGINEYSDDEALAASLRKAVATYRHLRVRFVVTCRDIYWINFREALRGDAYRINSGGLRRYTDTEFSSALSRYIEEYGLTGVRIEAAAREAFRSPILLRFFCEAYSSRNPNARHNAPSRVAAINLKKLFDDYLRVKLQRVVDASAVKRKYGEFKGNRTIEARMLRIADCIRRRRLPYLIHEQVQEALEGEDVDSRASSLSLLLDEDVILEERSGRVFFVYEAFMEYAIAKSALREADARNARELLLQLAQETDGFRNMRGVVLMALVILAEDHRIGMASALLPLGPKWTAIVLSAASQIQSNRLNTDWIGTLGRIAESGFGEERTLAARLLMTRCGEQGRAEYLRMFERSSPRRQSELVSFLASASTADLLPGLFTLLARGHDGVASVLQAIRPNRRAMAHLKNQLNSDNVRVLTTVIRMLRNCKPGEMRSAIALASPFARDPRIVLADAARTCVSHLAQRLAESEDQRRAKISLTRRARAHQRAR
jgi:hypothetical protein